MEKGLLQHYGTLQEITAAGYDFKAIATTDSNEISTKDVDQTFEDKSEPEKSSTDEAAISKKSTGFTPYIFYGQMATWKFALAGVVRELQCCTIASTVRLSQCSFLSP